ncbi:MAG: sensor histidine kinase [Cyanobacteria bacterium RYN_339]|nr:sensor histidine kinase [Cyanobacteria bacterium RYN_339]
MLAEFAAFLKAGLVEEIAADHLRRWRAMDLGITRLFQAVPDAELLPQFEASMHTFCDDMIAGRRIWRLREVLRLWEEDRLPNIPKEAIEHSDLALANLSQREAILAFVPRFTADVGEAIAIVNELNTLIQGAKAETFEIFVRQREELTRVSAALAAEIAEHCATEAKLVRHAARLQMRAELSAEIARTVTDVHGFTGLVARRVAELMDASVLIHLVTPDGAHLRLAAEHGNGAPGHQQLLARFQDWDIPLALHPLAPYTAPLLVADATQPPPEAMRLAQSRPGSPLPLRSWMAVPLRSREALIGVLGVLRLTGAPPLDEEDLEFLQDLGDRTVLALENARLYADLEGRVADRTRELGQINQELEAFGYSVSHDLRSPLRSIDGFSQALLEDYGDQLDATGRDYLLRVRTATGRMGELIDAMLEMSRLARAPLRHQVVDLGTMAEEVLADLARGQARETSLHVQPGVVVSGDPRLLRVVLENLLGNAWKYAGKREVIVISFRAVQEGGEVVYEVRDNGAGFDMAYADKLFRPFARLHGARDFEGSGVGLATVQRIVARHGGRIWGEGTPGVGATFRFTLGQAPM